MTAVRYRPVAGASAGASESGGDFVASFEYLSETTDPASPLYDPDASIKTALGHAIWHDTSRTPTKRALAQQFASSSLNFAALVCATPDQPGATPASIQKLLTRGRRRGGACWSDMILKGACMWQMEDETFQMTSNDGRVVWRPA